LSRYLGPSLLLGEVGVLSMLCRAVKRCSGVWEVINVLK